MKKVLMLYLIAVIGAFYAPEGKCAPHDNGANNRRAAVHNHRSTAPGRNLAARPHHPEKKAPHHHAHAGLYRPAPYIAAPPPYKIHGFPVIYSTGLYYPAGIFAAGYASGSAVIQSIAYPSYSYAAPIYYGNNYAALRIGNFALSISD